MRMAENEPHFETDAARGASSPNIVRWVLLVSLFAAIVLLSIIWITGAATQSDAEENVEVTSRAEDMNDERESIEDTDSIVGEDADQIEAAEPGQADPARTVENENQDAAPAGTDAN
jgi:hypothetical protein